MLSSNNCPEDIIHGIKRAMNDIDYLISGIGPYSGKRCGTYNDNEE
jgi:hypothetical protein